MIKKSLSLIVFLVAFGSLAGSAVAGPPSISGTVKVFGAGTPIAGVEVCAENQITFNEECADTGGDGKYSIDDLGVGSYMVGFFPAEGVNYLRQWYFEKVKPGESQLVSLSAGEEETGIDANLKPGGQITGKVTDAGSGNGIGGMEVCAIDTANAINRPCVETAGDGSYAIVALSTGSYKVEFEPGGTDYLFQMYNGVADYSAATALSVTAGGSPVPNINAALVKGATISGRVTDGTTGAGLEEVLVCPYGGTLTELEGCDETAPDGTYALRHLVAGSYKVGFSEEPDPVFGDDYDTQFFDGKASLVEATAVSLALGQSRTGIDAKLNRTGTTRSGGGSGGGALTPSLVVLPVVPSLTSTKLICKKGLKKKTVKGKAKCVKAKKRKKKRRKH